MLWSRTSWNLAGYGFMLHGVQLFGALGGEPVELVSLFGAAALIEILGGAFIVLGLFTRLAAFIASGEMAVAYFMAHVAREVALLFPVANGGEPPVLYSCGPTRTPLRTRWAMPARRATFARFHRPRRLHRRRA